MAYTEVTPGKGWLDAIVANLKDLQIKQTNYQMTGINGFDLSGINLYSLQFNGRNAYLVNGQISYTGSDINAAANGDMGTISSDCPWPSWQWCKFFAFDVEGTFCRNGNKIIYTLSKGNMNKNVKPQVSGLFYW